eukprot:12167308-Alexandrium_andersonii.AAC.1
MLCTKKAGFNWGKARNTQTTVQDRPSPRLESRFAPARIGPSSAAWATAAARPPLRCPPRGILAGSAGLVRPSWPGRR